MQSMTDKKRDFETACAQCVDAPTQVFHPIEANAAVYRRAYPIFQDIYRQNKDIFARIDALSH